MSKRRQGVKAEREAASGAEQDVRLSITSPYDCRQQHTVADHEQLCVARPHTSFDLQNMSEESVFTIKASSVTLGAVLAKGSPGITLYLADLQLGDHVMQVPSKLLRVAELLKDSAVQALYRWQSEGCKLAVLQLQQKAPS